MFMSSKKNPGPASRAWWGRWPWPSRGWGGPRGQGKALPSFLKSWVRSRPLTGKPWALPSSPVPASASQRGCCHPCAPRALACVSMHMCASVCECWVCVDTAEVSGGSTLYRQCGKSLEEGQGPWWSVGRGRGGAQLPETWSPGFRTALCWPTDR